MRRAAQPSHRLRLAADDGAALVEAALMLPFLLVILFGILDFAVVMNDWNSVRNGNREGARQGIVYTTGGDSSCALIGGAAPNTATHELICLVKDRVGLNETDTRVMLTFSDADASGTVDNADYLLGDGSLIVCIQYPVESITGAYGGLLDSRTITSRVEMRIDEVNDVTAGEDPIELHAETPHTDWMFC